MLYRRLEKKGFRSPKANFYERVYFATALSLVPTVLSTLARTLNEEEVEAREGVRAIEFAPSSLSITGFPTRNVTIWGELARSDRRNNKVCTYDNKFSRFLSKEDLEDRTERKVKSAYSNERYDYSCMIANRTDIKSKEYIVRRTFLV